MKWKHGQKAEIARRAGITPQRLCNILNRRGRATVEQSFLLEQASREIGREIPAYDFVFSKETDNPLFGPKKGD